jgi:hypothetical protein
LCWVSSTAAAAASPTRCTATRRRAGPLSRPGDTAGLWTGVTPPPQVQGLFQVQTELGQGGFGRHSIAGPGQGQSRRGPQHRTCTDGSTGSAQLLWRAAPACPPGPAPVPGKSGESRNEPRIVQAHEPPMSLLSDLHGAHDFRHTSSTWLEDVGIRARVIDELMGDQASGRAGRPPGSTIGPLTATPPRSWPLGWWLWSRSAWSLSSRRRGRPRSPTLVTVSVAAATVRHLLADSWPTTLRG